MKSSVNLFFAALLFVFVPVRACAQAQMTTITASAITDAGGNLMAQGTMTWSPTDCNGNALGFHVGSGGWAIPKAAVAKIAAGGITGDLSGNTFKVADTSHTSPLNVCYDVTIYDQIAKHSYPTIHGVQPTGTTWSWDAYSYSTIPLALQSVIFGGDLSGNAASQTVVGLRGNSVPSPTVGNLHWNNSINTLVWDQPWWFGSGTPGTVAGAQYGDYYFDYTNLVIWHCLGSINCSSWGVSGILNGAQATTTVNGHALSSNVTLGFGDIAAGSLANGTAATTQARGDNSTKVATTAYVDRAAFVDGNTATIFSGILAGTGNGISTPGTVISTTALPNGMTATTQSQGDNSTKVATTAYVDNANIPGYGSCSAGNVVTGVLLKPSNPTCATIATILGYTPASNATTVNGHALSSNVTLGFSDLGTALPNGTTATTQAASDNSSNVSTTQYADTAVANARNAFVTTDLSWRAFYAGVPPSSTEVLYLPVGISTTITGFCAGSQAKAKAAATGSTVFTLYKNGTSFGTITFGAGATSGSFSCPSGGGESFSAGDVFEIIGGGDATLGTVGFSIGIRQAL